MPVIEPDPWRQGYFAHANCPPDVTIPTKDTDAYRLNPRHAWAYNKLMVAEKQGLVCGPHGIEPAAYPVFSKPVYNLRSMGAGSGILADAQAYAQGYAPGFMWCEVLQGMHLSTDMAVVGGKCVWAAHTTGYPLAEGTFDYWHILPEPNPPLEAYLTDFVARHFAGYTGMMNFETIGGKIIEMHLRFADQWADLYGPGFVTNLVSLYAAGQWAVPMPPKEAFSMVLFLPHRQYKKPPQAAVEALVDGAGVTSIQMPFHEHVSHTRHSMPPGGFRVAVVNGFSREKCRQAREQVKALFLEVN